MKITTDRNFQVIMLVVRWEEVLFSAMAKRRVFQEQATRLWQEEAQLHKQGKQATQTHTQIQAIPPNLQFLRWDPADSKWQDQPTYSGLRSKHHPY